MKLYWLLLIYVLKNHYIGGKHVLDNIFSTSWFTPLFSIQGLQLRYNWLTKLKQLMFLQFETHISGFRKQQRCLKNRGFVFPKVCLWKRQFRGLIFQKSVFQNMNACVFELRKRTALKFRKDLKLRMQEYVTVCRMASLAGCQERRYVGVHSKEAMICTNFIHSIMSSYILVLGPSIKRYNP